MLFYDQRWLMPHYFAQNQSDTLCTLTSYHKLNERVCLSHFALSPLLCTCRIKRAVPTCTVSCCHNCGMTFYNDFNYRETPSIL